MIKKTSAPVNNIPATKKLCFFCVASRIAKKVPTYTDSAILHKFTTERGKLVGKSRSGLCAKHQRQVTKQVKYARHLSILPFAVQA